MISSAPMTAKNSFIFGTNLKNRSTEKPLLLKKECEAELVVRLVHFRRKKVHVIIAVVSATSA